MKNKYKVLGIVSVLIVVIIGSMYLVLIQNRQAENGQKASPITDIEQPEVIKQPEDNKGVEEPKESEIKEVDEADLKTLTLFTADIDTYDIKESESIEITEDLSIEKQLTLIANELSQTQFDNLPIELKGIEEIDGQKIAVINLREKGQLNDQDKNWMQYLNGGSTGSRITLITLEESFLQRDLAGEWVDGIKIIYEGENIEEMDHFPSTHIIYRTK
ncbi:MAG: hypothetical protein K0S71_734 [Clostridia bacterium]|jgi:hypothetical protein|nr:hypothetical protein [Clostridia bacterium]